MGASDANIDQAWIRPGYATSLLIQSGCSCLRNFGTAALMNSVSLTSVMISASTATSRPNETSRRNCSTNGARGAATATTGAGGGTSTTSADSAAGGAGSRH